MEPQPTLPDRATVALGDFPGLYRAALEAAAELERRGDRRGAARLRREAAEAYAVWDDQGHRRLVALIEAARLRHGEPPRRGRSR